MNLIEGYRRGVHHLETGNAKEAARLLEVVAAAEPSNCEVRLRLAMAYFSSARLAKAEGQLRVLVDRDPTDHYAHHLLGRTLERQGRAREALTHLRLAEAMASVPDYGTAVQRVAARVASG